MPEPYQGDLSVFQNVPLEQQMVNSIKQEPMECAIEQPPLKKIKQEVFLLNILNCKSKAEKCETDRIRFLNVAKQRRE